MGACLVCFKPKHDPKPPSFMEPTPPFFNPCMLYENEWEKVSCSSLELNKDCDVVSDVHPVRLDARQAGGADV